MPRLKILFKLDGYALRSITPCAFPIDDDTPLGVPLLHKILEGRIMRVFVEEDGVGNVRDVETVSGPDIYPDEVCCVLSGGGYRDGADLRWAMPLDFPEGSGPREDCCGKEQRRYLPQGRANNGHLIGGGVHCRVRGGEIRPLLFRDGFEEFQTLWNLFGDGGRFVFDKVVFHAIFFCSGKDTLPVDLTSS